MHDRGYGAPDTGRQTSKEGSVRYVRIILAAASLAAGGEQAVNAGDLVLVRVVDSTGLTLGLHRFGPYS
jgi:hypothetical protein